LNACPYRATVILHRRPRVLGSIEATTILTRGEGWAAPRLASMSYGAAGRATLAGVRVQGTPVRSLPQVVQGAHDG